MTNRRTPARPLDDLHELPPMPRIIGTDGGAVGRILVTVYSEAQRREDLLRLRLEREKLEAAIQVRTHAAWCTQAARALVRRASSASPEARPEILRAARTVATAAVHASARAEALSPHGGKRDPILDALDELNVIVAVPGAPPLPIAEAVPPATTDDAPRRRRRRARRQRMGKSTHPTAKDQGKQDE